MTSRDRVRLLQEAAALESAAGNWTYAHVEALTGYSETTIRGSDCPRHERDTPGSTKGRIQVIFKPAEVRAWYEAGVRKAS